MVSVCPSMSTLLQTYLPCALSAAAVTRNEPTNVFSLSVADFTKDFKVNTTSAYAAAQQATLGFEQLPESASRTFIYSGNIMNNNVAFGPLLTLGVGK
jgi:hypothetical protein